MGPSLVDLDLYLCRNSLTLIRSCDCLGGASLSDWRFCVILVDADETSVCIDCCIEGLETL